VVVSGQDQKTWGKLEDAHTVVICVDKLINPKMDMMSDQVMLFLRKLIMKGSLHGLIGAHHAGQFRPAGMQKMEVPSR